MRPWTMSSTGAVAAFSYFRQRASGRRRVVAAGSTTTAARASPSMAGSGEQHTARMSSATTQSADASTPTPGDRSSASARILTAGARSPRRARTQSPVLSHAATGSNTCAEKEVPRLGGQRSGHNFVCQGGVKRSGLVLPPTSCFASPSRTSILRPGLRNEKWRGGRPARRATNSSHTLMRFPPRENLSRRLPRRSRPSPGDR